MGIGSLEQVLDRDHGASESQRPARRVGGRGVPTIGREDELRALQRSYTGVVERGTAHVVNLIGTDGLGKSRLLDDLAEWLGNQPGPAPHFLRGRAVSAGRSTPRRALRSVVTHRFAIRADDTSNEVGDKLGRGLSSLTPPQTAVVGQWLGFDLTESDGVRDLVGNPEFGTIALGHLTARFEALITSAPVVMLLEDLHWSDPESLDAIGHIVDAFRHAPVFVVCAAAPSMFELRPRWSAGPRDATTTIDLTPLGTEDRRLHVLELLQRLEGAPPEFVDLIVDRADGNPLHAELLVELLIDNDVIVDDAEPWSLDPGRVDTLERVDLPDSLHAAIRARLDLLHRRESDLLQQASVIGTTFWDDALVTLAGGSGHRFATHAEVASALSALEERGFVQADEWSAFTGCRQFSFTHALVRDVAREIRPAADRSRDHLAAAGWLERRARDRQGENVAELAEQLAEAGELERAADLFHEAGARAALTGASQSGLACYGRSLEFRQTTGTEHGMAATSTRLELGHLLGHLGRYDEAASAYADAESDADRNGSRRLAANAMAGALRTAAARGDWQVAGRLVERVRPLAERFGGEILGRFLSGEALLLIDGPHQDLDSARRLIERARELWRGLEDPSSELRAVNELGLACWKGGAVAEASRWYDDGIAIARRIGDTSGESMLVQNQAVLAHLEARAGRADYERVIDLYRASLDRRRRLGLPHALNLANLAQAEVEAGRLADGRRDATEALRLGWERHDPVDWTIALITFAQLDFATGRHSDGLAILASLLAARRSPFIEQEIDAVLALHDVDPSSLDDLATNTEPQDIDRMVQRLLRGRAPDRSSDA